MNMPETAVLDTAHAESLRREARQSDVVVFHSRLTDTRALREWLEANAVEHRFVEMSMASGEERARFRALEQMTGWRWLPQVFFGGEFIGGAQELFSLGAQRQVGSRVFPETLGTLLHRLGYAGLIPFVAGVIGLAASGSAAWTGFVTWALLAYAAVILTFLGAVHWGRVLSAPAETHARELALWGVTPSILAWLAVLLPPVLALPLLVLLFGTVYVIDRQLLDGSQAGEVYLPLRARLTATVASLLTLAWLILLLR